MNVEEALRKYKGCVLNAKTIEKIIGEIGSKETELYAEIYCGC